MAANARSLRGLPIAAYLALLVALALAAAFIAVMAVVLWLPPRPPDVMRADMVSEHFKVGYEHMRAVGRPIDDHGMTWRVQAEAPHQRHLPQMHPTQHMLAGELDLQPNQVRIAAAQIQRSDVFVFRVRDAHEAARDARREVERLRREGRRGQVVVRGGGEPEIHVDADGAVIEQGFEIRVPEPLPEPGAAPVPRRRHAVSVAPSPPSPPAAPAPRAAVFAPAPPGTVLISGFEIGAQLPDGRWLVMRQGRNWAELSWIGRATVIIGGTLLILSLLAVWFARRLTRPIRNFSDAVQAVGVDPQSEPVREEGPRELRGAARAVNTMQARLRALIADRTKTLAAVAHDMRTPLMRLRLTAENAPPEQRDKMAREIEEVEALVASFIAFARDDPAEEARVRLDLSALLHSIADDHAEAGRNVSFTSDERVIITGQSLGLKRLFSNLVDNALKYGASARIKLRREENAVIVDVEDDGPGIPSDQRESVFEPFVRLNAEGTRGAGLGLAAARSIARAHGGDIVILDAEHGALLRVTLPS